MIAGTGRAALTAVKVGSQGLRSRPMRTFLAAISLFLGVLSVVMVHAAADIAERAVTERAELSSGRSPTYTSELAAGGARGLDHLASVTTGTGASATVTVPGLLGDPSETAGGSGRVSLELVGLHGDLRRARPFRLAAGAWLPTGGPSSLAPRLVLNTAAAEAIPAGGGRVPAALTIAGGQVRPTPRLIGVVDDGTDQPAAYARLDELLRWEPTLLERFGPKLVVHEPGGAERAVLNTDRKSVV